MENAIKSKLLSIKKEDTIENIQYIKQQQIRELYKHYTNEEIEYYKELEFNGDIEDVKSIQISLEFVENELQEKMFDYYRNVVSSIPHYNIPGRQVKILIKDNNTKKYLGLLQLTIDLLVNANKNKFLQINEKDYGKYKKIIRDCGVNISICVPLQPFGFNYCGGKLLSMLAFSNDIYNYYYKRYNIKIAYIITTSINGKSIQYSRLKCLKYIGLTDGYGTGHIQDDIVNECKKFIIHKYPKYNIKKMSKHTILNLVIKTLNLNHDILNHGQKRGIYIGLTSKNSCKYISEKLKDKSWKPDLLESTQNIYEQWLEKYAIKRYKHLSKTNRINKK